MINILLVEDDEIDVINVKQAFKKINIINPVHLVEMMATLNKYWILCEMP
ncbi:MAG: hypothetical protein V7K30_30150 [Nostoc sp.]